MLGYCTNVHSGDSFDDVVHNLKTFTWNIQQNLQKPLGVGLWLSDSASREVDTSQLCDVLQKHNLHVFTLNGFPFSNFHQKVIKHKVYKPNWSEESRLAYTVRLARILAAITNQDVAGISTLPLGWNDDSFTNEDCVSKLNWCVDALEEIEQQTSKCIHLDIETEPGCRLQRSKELCDFFEEQFGDNERVRRYIRVCHDTCHAAVMRESADACVANYKNVGLLIGKVQISSAIEFELGLNANTSFIVDEHTYLHQSSVQLKDGIQYFDDFSDITDEIKSGSCRVHFHVPIHLKSFGELQTTQHDLLESIPILKEAGVTQWEIETYTWNVTPTTLQKGELVASITEELAWASNQLSQ